MSFGKTRSEAIARMQRALGEIELHGPKTTLPFHHVILTEEDFVIGDYTMDLSDKPDVRNKLGTDIF